MTGANHDSSEEIVQVDFDTERDEPGMAVVQTIADLEGSDAIEYPPIYDCIDHVIDHVFSEPPAPEAQVEVSFSYQDYRITVHQDGTAMFRKVSY